MENQIKEDIIEIYNIRIDENIENIICNFSINIIDSFLYKHSQLSLELFSSSLIEIQIIEKILKIVFNKTILLKNIKEIEFHNKIKINHEKEVFYTQVNIEYLDFDNIICIVKFFDFNLNKIYLKACIDFKFLD